MPHVYLSVKGISAEIAVPEEAVLRHIGWVLRPTARDAAVMPALDRLQAEASVDRLQVEVAHLLRRGERVSVADLEVLARAEVRDAQVLDWLMVRVQYLAAHATGDGRLVIPAGRLDDLGRRLVIGLLYAARIEGALDYVVVMLDDASAFLTAEPSTREWLAVMRPYIVTVDGYPSAALLTSFRPVFITPGRLRNHPYVRSDSYAVINGRSPAGRIPAGRRLAGDVLRLAEAWRRGQCR